MKLLPRWTVAFCAALLALAALVPLAPGYALPVRRSDAEQATLTVLRESVTVVAPDSGRAHPGQSGESVHAGDRVLTGPTGGALLTFSDGSEQELDAGTEVRIRALGRTAGGGLLVALATAVGVTVNRVVELAPFSSYQLQTPSAAAMVRGTTFRSRVVRAAGSGRVAEEDLSVDKGSVEVRSEPGRGASFTVRLPRAAAGAESEPELAFT